MNTTQMQTNLEPAMETQLAHPSASATADGVAESQPVETHWSGFHPAALTASDGREYVLLAKAEWEAIEPYLPLGEPEPVPLEDRPLSEQQIRDALEPIGVPFTYYSSWLDAYLIAEDTQESIATVIASFMHLENHERAQPAPDQSKLKHWDARCEYFLMEKRRYSWYSLPDRQKLLIELYTERKEQQREFAAYEKLAANRQAA